MKQKLVVVADTCQANFIESVGFSLTKTIKSLKNQKFNAKIPDDRRNGRMTGHFFDPSTTAKEHETQSFASIIADEIIDIQQDGVYGEVILVAAPKLLGELRKHLDDNLAIDRCFSRVATSLPHHKIEELIFS